jgi:rhodanese-related sulfurtransferase
MVIMYKSINIKEIDNIIIDTNNILIDIRDKYEYILGNLKRSINIPYNYLMLVPDEYLNKNKRYYIYCDTGTKSRKLCMHLSNLGYSVVDLVGGIKDYLV